MQMYKYRFNKASADLLVFAAKQMGNRWVRLFSERIQAMDIVARGPTDVKPVL